MLDAYYSYDPLVTLERPLCVCGPLGAPVAQVASMISQRTGLPFVETDRWIEHEAGASLTAAVIRDGLRATQRRQRRMVARALKQRPFPVIALGESALQSFATRHKLARHCDLVHLRLRPRTLLDRIREVPVENRYPFVEAPGRVELVEDYLATRARGLESAQHIVDADGVSILELAEIVLAKGLS